MIEEFNGIQPTVDPTAWVYPSAVVIGKVTLAKDVSIWPTAVLRGDIEPIEIGEGTSFQDGSVAHTSANLPTKIGKRVVVGHRATLHGAIVGDDCMIGMGASMLDGSKLGTGSILAAGALLAEGKTIPPNSVAVGVPARVIRQVTDAERERIRKGAQEYIGRSEAYKRQK